MPTAKPTNPRRHPPSLQRFSLDELAPFTKEETFSTDASRHLGTFVVKDRPGGPGYKAQNNTLAVFTDPDTTKPKARSNAAMADVCLESVSVRPPRSPRRPLASWRRRRCAARHRSDRPPQPETPSLDENELS